jgi:hypothetical protein
MLAAIASGMLAIPNGAQAFPFANNCASMQAYFNNYGKRAPLKAYFQNFENAKIDIKQRWVSEGNIVDKRPAILVDVVAICKDGFITEKSPQGTQVCRGDIEYAMEHYGTTGWTASRGNCVWK